MTSKFKLHFDHKVCPIHLLLDVNSCLLQSTNRLHDAALFWNFAKIIKFKIWWIQLRSVFAELVKSQFKVFLKYQSLNIRTRSKSRWDSLNISFTKALHSNIRKEQLSPESFSLNIWTSGSRLPPSIELKVLPFPLLSPPPSLGQQFGGKLKLRLTGPVRHLTL